MIHPLQEGTTMSAKFSWLLAAVVWIGVADNVAAQFRPAPNEVHGAFKSADGKNITIVIGDRREPTTEKSFALAKDVEVAVGSGGRSFGGLLKEAKLSDLSE